VTQFIMERNTKRLAEQAAHAARKQVEAAKQPTTDPALKVADESEALLN